MADAHSPLIKTWQQLVVVVAASFIVPVVLILMIAALVTGGKKGLDSDDSALLARIQPVGTVQLAAGPRAAMSGEQVYGAVCKTCHDAGLAGAHKLGDKAAWGKVIAQGEKLTFEHAIKGLRAMPAKGGNPDLSDAEVQAAVVHMVNAAGAGWKAPAVAAPAPAAASAAAPAERSGQQVVDASCGKCHQSGERGAPKIGDRGAWIQRAKRGLDSVYASALKGHAGMPARGGMAELNDAEVKRAVEFMMNSGSGAPVAVAALPPAAPAAAKADGKAVYDKACTACHTPGIAGAPKTGDKAGWAPRLAQGAAVLHDHAIKGFQGKAGVMPAKGGNTALSDDEVKAAVDWMVGQAK